MIKIVSKSYCPYCDMAKELIKNLWYKYEEIDVTNDQKKMEEIVAISEMMTVPQIFSWKIESKNLLWGYDDILKLNNDWKLLEILKKL